MKRIDPTDPEDRAVPEDQATARRLWRRAQQTEFPENDTERFLDLAAFADGMLDPDERERIAARLAADPDRMADVAAARALAAGIPMPSVPRLEHVIARASTLVPKAAREREPPEVRPRSQRMVLRAVAQWGSMAAAVVIAGWLGFSLGSDAWSGLHPQAQTAGDNLAAEMFDSGTSLLGDLGDGPRT